MNIVLSFTAPYLLSLVAAYFLSHLVNEVVMADSRMDSRQAGRKLFEPYLGRLSDRTSDGYRTAIGRLSDRTSDGYRTAIGRLSDGYRTVIERRSDCHRNGLSDYIGIVHIGNPM